MNIVILHNAVSCHDFREDLEKRTQVGTISDSLSRLGHHPIPVLCSLDLAALRETLLERRPQLVFNLVESLGGTDSLSYLATAVLDALGLPYTGNSTEALFTTNHKLMAKRLMRFAGLPTPHWLSEPGNRDLAAIPLDPPCIIKSVWEYGSRGMNHENVIREGDMESVGRRLREFTARTARAHFAEMFIEGREFNLAMLDGTDGPQILPVREMDPTFSADKPRTIGDRAKWHESSSKGNNMPRSFHFPKDDHPLIEHLTRLARDCWRLFGLRGYVRVDFLVDRTDRPWILDVNTNPSLSPEAGYVAAFEEAGLDFDDAVRRIIEKAIAAEHRAVNGRHAEVSVGA